MKVLWLCNVVLPEFCDEFGFKKVNVGGWLTGMWNELKKRSELELGICCPIYKEEFMKDGVKEGIKYYSFKCLSLGEYSSEQEKRFVDIISDFQPDLVHIWGTEYPHTLAMINACEKSDLLDKTAVNIQGLTSVYSVHYTDGLPYDIAESEDVKQNVLQFKESGNLEIEALKKKKHVIGRTDWDKACVYHINPDAQYHFCNEILRERFSANAGTWEYEKCEKHSIFVSQASYPIKGFHFLIKALPLILNKFPDTKVYVAGTNITEQDGAYARYISEQIKENKLENNIVFLGMLTEKEMCERYKRSNVFISASTIENESNSISEAKMIGCPVVASYVGGISNRITHKVDGYVYPVNEFYMLAYYVCQIFEGKGLSIQISRNAVESAKITNDREINVNKCMDIYKVILNN